MANKAKKDNKGAIIGCICAVVAIVVVVVVAVVLSMNNNRLNDSYFVSDGTKYVITVESDAAELEGDEYTPIKTHLVYTYSGEEITGLKGYYEYADDAKAQAAANYLKENAADAYKEIAVEGKYVVVTSNEADYEGVTTSDVKQQIEFMESLKNSNNNGTTETTEPTGEVVEVTESETTQEQQGQ